MGWGQFYMVCFLTYNSFICKCDMVCPESKFCHDFCGSIKPPMGFPKLFFLEHEESKYMHQCERLVSMYTKNKSRDPENNILWNSR